MPMGSKSSSHTYQNIAEQLIYRNIDDENYNHYIDDGCSFGDDFERLMKDYAKNNMELNIMKCKFFVPVVRICGFRREGIEGGPIKAAGFEKLEITKTRKALHKSLSAINYYQNMIQ